jgi:hypothetical protein
MARDLVPAAPQASTADPLCARHTPRLCSAAGLGTAVRASLSTSSSAVTVRIRRSVAALQSDLVHTQATELFAMREEALVDAQPAVGVGVELGHPGPDAVRVELVVPRPVQRVGEADPPCRRGSPLPSAALRRAVCRCWRVRGAVDDSAEPYGSHLLRVRRVRHVELLHLTGAPAGHVKEPVVDREVDVGDERRHRSEGLQRRRQQIRVGGFGGNGDDLLGLPPVAVAKPAPYRTNNSTMPNVVIGCLNASRLVTAPLSPRCLQIGFWTPVASSSDSDCITTPVRDPSQAWQPGARLLGDFRRPGGAVGAVGAAR